MLTLSRWRDFARTPKTIIFPHMELIGYDHAPPVVVGTGEVRMTSQTDFTFELTGVPQDVSYALSELNRHHNNRYEPLSRLRLLGVDSEGISWSGGYTVPQVDTNRPSWIFRGEIDGLITDVQGEAVSPEASTELIFPLRIGDPLTIGMAGFIRTREPSGEFIREYTADILGTSIRFVFEDAASTLLVTAPHSPMLPAPYAENWLGEPLRILFGQLTFPRLVARNFGNGKAAIFVRPSPGVLREARWAALLERDDLFGDTTAFWSLYANLLTMIATARDKKGLPNFEPNKITRLYEEAIQASRGSRWVWALTFASCIEAVTKMLSPQSGELNQKDSDAIAALVEYIKAGPGESRLKEIAANAVHRTAEVSTRTALRELQAQAVLTKAQVSAWEKIRNAVMHGSLIPPYSSEEDDTRLLALASTMHALTRELIRRTKAE